MNLGFFADWASIIALLVSMFNAYQITTVKRRMLINLTLPETLARLRDDSLQMNQLLLEYCISRHDFNNDKSRHDFDQAIGVCEANVRAVKRRFGLRRGRFCNELLGLIAAYRTKRRHADARSVYNALQQVIQEIANRIEEIRITGP